MTRTESENRKHSSYREKIDDSDYNNGTDQDGEHDHDNQSGQADKSHINEKNNEYIRDCLSERQQVEKKCPIATRLIDIEIEKVQQTGRIGSREPRYADVYREKPLRLSQKIIVPLKQHPKFNFVGKILGPKGNSLRRLQEETLCKITVLGKNSMRDREKEEELRSSKDPKYAHLNSDLHVEISTIAPPAEAYARMAYAMAELRKYLIPDSNDTIRQEQLRELMIENPNIELEHKIGSKKIPSSSSSSKPSSKPGSAPTSAGRTAVPAKQKVLSILDRARTAMEESYKRYYDEPPVYDPSPSYESSYYHPHPPSSRPYESMSEYEPPDYRRGDYYTRSPSHTVKQSVSSSARAASWKPIPSTYVPRRHEDLSSSAGPSKSYGHEARYRSAPYPRVK